MINWKHRKTKSRENTLVQYKRERKSLSLGFRFMRHEQSWSAFLKNTNSFPITFQVNQQQKIKLRHRLQLWRKYLRTKSVDTNALPFEASQWSWKHNNSRCVVVQSTCETRGIDRRSNDFTRRKKLYLRIHKHVRIQFQFF